jgi:hypothetical protein
MSSIVHTVQIMDPQSGSDFLDRMIVGQRLSVATAAGGGARRHCLHGRDLHRAVAEQLSSDRQPGVARWVVGHHPHRARLHREHRAFACRYHAGRQHGRRSSDLELTEPEPETKRRTPP